NRSGELFLKGGRGRRRPPGSTSGPGPLGGGSKPPFGVGRHGSNGPSPLGGPPLSPSSQAMYRVKTANRHAVVACSQIKNGLGSPSQSVQSFPNFAQAASPAAASAIHLSLSPVGSVLFSGSSPPYPYGERVRLSAGSRVTNCP